MNIYLIKLSLQFNARQRRTLGLTVQSDDNKNGTQHGFVSISADGIILNIGNSIRLLFRLTETN